MQDVATSDPLQDPYPFFMRTRLPHELAAHWCTPPVPKGRIRPLMDSVDSSTPENSTIYPAQFPAGSLAPEPRTLIEILQATAQAHPDAPAIDDGSHIESYAELIEEVKTKALRLHQSGLGAGDRIGVRVTSGTAALYEWILAILWVGAAYVPVDADDPDERAKTVFDEAQVAGFISGTDQLTVIDPLRATPFPNPRAPRLGDDAWIIFTSGSTGKPKGVAVTHRSAAAFVDAEAQMFLPADPLNTSDRVLAGLSVAFDASCEEMWIAWRNGSCLVPAPRALVRSGMDLGPWLISRSITAVSTVPTLAALWPAQALDSVRLLIFGGEACPPELAARLATDSRELWNTYGPTEATVVACGATMDGSLPVRIGLPLAGWDLAVVDPEGIPVSEGESGELIIGGVGLARYLDPEKEAEKYAPMPTLGWDRAYRSGDMVINDPLGLVFIGRVDDQVKIGGRRIELGEIDAALASLEGVSNAAVAVRETNTGNKMLVGYLAAAADYDLSAARTALLEDLPAAMVPLLTLVDTMPMKTSGKVDRNALPWPLAGAGEQSEEELHGLDETGQFVADAWQGALGAPVSSADADFFGSGGGSLSAAQLVSALRSRYPDLTVAELYDYPRFGALVEYLGGQQINDEVIEPRIVKRTRRITQITQTLLAVPLFILSGLRWFTYLMLGHWFLLSVGILEAQLPIPWYSILASWLIFVTPAGRMCLSIVASKLLLRGLTPGTYQRSGSMHLRLWLAQHISDVVDPISLASAPLLPWYARMLGADIDKTATMHTLPPVTGMLTVGPGATLEPEVDVSGYWIDGDKVHVGHVSVGDFASVGARTTLVPGAVVAPHTIVEAGSAIYGETRENSRYAGSPAAREGRAKPRWPEQIPSYRLLPRVLGALGSVLLNLLQWLPVVLAVLAVTPLLRAEDSLTSIGWKFIPAVLLAALVWFLSMMALIVIEVRLLSIGLVEGWHPVTSRVGWQAWATERVLDTARDVLFPLYASLFTPVWLRLLGAKVGRDVEISTVLLIPKMTTIASGAFLADDTMVASYELGGGWMHIAPVRVGKKAFLGNSGILHAGRRVPKRSLIAVLSATPRKMKAGTSWIGSPPHKLRRTTVDAESERTYQPPMKLKVMRALWELTRALAVFTTVGIAGGVLWALSALATHVNPLTAALLSGAVLVVAGAVAALTALAAKWLVVGVIRPGEHTLWSSFIWRTEMVDSFVELVCAQWFARLASGTPALVWFLRAQGAKIGHGVWCESYWFPEADLVTLEDHATVNRGCVLQTHLFHDRIMSIDTVTLGAGGTLGPHSVILPAAVISEGTTAGPASLILRGERLPANTYWRGNPAVRWNITTDQPVKA